MVLDDADARLDLADQRVLFEALAAICASGPAIAISTTEVAALPTDVPRLALTRPSHSPADSAAASPEKD